MSRLTSYIKTFALWELWQGLSVTFRNFFRRSITIQYPEDKTPQSVRFRGLHALRRYPNGEVPDGLGAGDLERTGGCRARQKASIERDYSPPARFSGAHVSSSAAHHTANRHLTGCIPYAQRGGGLSHRGEGVGITAIP